MRSDISRARHFRSHMSDAEILLWSRLKRLRAHGFHIRRQAPFKGYFLDFVCYARRVAIEVDGSQHGDDRQADHDLVRDRVLRQQGFLVLRVLTVEVRTNLDGVMQRIVGTLEARPSARDGADHREAPRSDPHFPTLIASRSVPPH